MWEKQVSTVDVLFSFNGKDQYARPVLLTWNDEDFALGGVQFWYAEHKKGALVHHYTVGDKEGRFTFYLALETENLTWRLEKAVSTDGSKLKLQLNRSLVGALS